MSDHEYRPVEIREVRDLRTGTRVGSPNRDRFVCVSNAKITPYGTCKVTIAHVANPGEVRRFEEREWLFVDALVSVRMALPVEQDGVLVEAL